MPRARLRVHSLLTKVLSGKGPNRVVDDARCLRDAFMSDHIAAYERLFAELTGKTAAPASRRRRNTGKK